MKILVATADFIISYKPHGLPTVPLKAQAPACPDTLLSRMGKLFPDILNPLTPSFWEGGTVHRLDTATAGLVLFARSKSFMDHILSEQQCGRFLKTYRAVCSVPASRAPADALPFVISSYFRAYGPGRKMVKPETDPKRADSSVLYTTKVISIDQNVINVEITRGFRHQIRAHLAWKGLPIEGDPLYNPACTSSPSSGSVLQLECTALAFNLPDGTPFEYRIP